MTDRTPIVVKRQPLRGPACRDRYEPRDDGRWTHIEERWTGCEWAYVGSEIVTDVDIEATAEVIQA